MRAAALRIPFRAPMHTSSSTRDSSRRLANLAAAVLAHVGSGKDSFRAMRTVTLFSVLSVGWQRLLTRHAGQGPQFCILDFLPPQIRLPVKIAPLDPREQNSDRP
jgi:hypothetical protein